jgi:general secretion pathway protein I
MILKSRRGFTLLEVMIAMAILAGAIFVLATTWSGNVSRVRNMQINATMATLLQKLMTETRLKYQDAIDQIPEEEVGEFENLQNYTWRITSRDFELPNLSSLVLAQQGEADQMLMDAIDQFSDHLAEAVKEVTGTVIYTRNNRTFEISASTYFVNFNLQMSALEGISGLPVDSGDGSAGGGQGQ